MAGQQAPVILQVSINGVWLDRGGHFPATPDQIAKVALECFDKGAAIIHNHIDRVKDGVNAAVQRYIESWKLIFSERPDALVFPTAHFERPDEPYSFEHIEPLAATGMLKLSFCDVGSPSFISEVRDGKALGTYVYANTLSDTVERLDRHRRLRLGTVINVYEVTGLRHFLSLHRAGKAPRGCSVNLYFAADANARKSPGFMGLPPSEAMIDLCLDMMRDTNLPWGVTLFGDDPIRTGLASLVLRKGGNLAIGLEAFGGDRKPSNQELVEEAVELCRREGRRPATPREAAAMLDLPRSSRLQGALSELWGKAG